MIKVLNLTLGKIKRVKFSGSYLKHNKFTYSHGTIVNIYIAYEISKNYNISSYPTSENCLFGAVNLTKNADVDQHKYSRYGIGFDRHGQFGFGSRGFGRNAIIFGVDLSSSVHANNKKDNILVLGKDFIQGINGTTIYAEKMYLINFTENNKKFVLSLHYNGDNSYVFVNGTEIHKFKAKDSEIVATPLCLGNISKDFSVDIMKKIGLNGYVYDFSVDYGAIAVDDILNIQKYLMEKNNIVKMRRFIKKAFAVITTFFNISYVNSLECMSTSNQECKARPKKIDVNNNEPVFYPYSINVNKCSGSCSNINDLYAKLCIPDIVKT